MPEAQKAAPLRAGLGIAAFQIVLLRSRVFWLTSALVGIAVVAIVLLSLFRPSALRERMETFLSERLDSDVEMRDFGGTPLAFHGPTWFGPGVDGAGLTLRQHGAAGPPLVEIDRFDVHVTPFGLFKQPRRIRLVKLSGVRVHLAPHAGGAENPATAGDPAWRSSPAIVDELIAEGGRLEIASKNPDKPPRVFDIHSVRLREASLETPTRFEADLSIPKPPGKVEATGTIGPWVRRDPDRTAVSGKYVFRHADLGVFKGISGILTSTGTFGGPLERIEVRGRTSTPRFTLTAAGNALPLETEFDAIVDGTSGDTILNVVRARLGESNIVTSGRVVRARDVKGRLIRLDVTVDRARLEDLLQLAIKGPRAPMSGEARIRARMALPPGEADVVDRLRLDGEFQLASARFANFDVQRAVTTLSQRGRGLAAQEAPRADSVVSNLAGAFSLADGRMRFSRLSFGVPGAQVRLTGDYHLRSEALNFQGVLVMDAALSDMTTGWKSALAKLGDLWFRRNGETVLPIRVGGSRDKPDFGLDTKRALLRKTN